MANNVRETGIYKKLGELSYFIPHPLPPANPSFHMNVEIMKLYGEASFALGQLNEMSSRLPDPKRFIKAYVIKEALLSSAIEGIHTTLIEVFTHVLGNSKPSKDTQLVLNYTEALEAALNMLRKKNLPLVERVILKAHQTLMTVGVDEKADPGSYRKLSVRVGELIPPPATEVPKLMSGLEKFINENSEFPPLIKAGFAHVHFETIHPFLDGNGRIGRLLIVLMLIDGGILNSPVLYPSYYFKKHHFEYYQRLDRVRTHGDYESWILYYLQAIKESALDAYTRAMKIDSLESKLRELIVNDSSFARMQKIAGLAINYLFMHPITDVVEMSNALGKAYNTIQNILSKFTEHGFIKENIVNKRNKIYRFETYLKLLEKEC